MIKTGEKSSFLGGTAKKICLFVLIALAVLIIIGVVVFLVIFFVTQKSSSSKKPANCTSNAYKTTDNLCACNYGYSGDGVNYCDECGLSYKTPNVRIVGGVEAVANSWPATVLIDFSFGGSYYITKLGKYIDVVYGTRCGGTIIDRTTVLTAAHCIVNSFKYQYNGNVYTIVVKPTNLFPTVESMYTVYSGVHDSSQIGIDQNIITHSVSKLIKHENYDSTTLLNDIALFKIKTPIQYTLITQPTCLPNSTYAKNSVYPADNVESWAAGWGLLSFNGQAPDKLYNVKLTVYNPSLCSSVSSNNDWNTQICAGEYKGGKDTCQGDSGGSLYVKDSVNLKTKYLTAGIVSYGFECAQPKSPGIYGRVSYYIPWIQKYTLAS